MPTDSLRSFGTEWRQAPPFHETSELGQAAGVGLAAGNRGEPSGKIKSPSNKEAGLDVSHHALVSREGRGENFFLDILFYRMSVITIFHQSGCLRRFCAFDRSPKSALEHRILEWQTALNTFVFVPK